MDPLVCWQRLLASVSDKGAKQSRSLQDALDLARWISEGKKLPGGLLLELRVASFNPTTCLGLPLTKTVERLICAAMVNIAEKTLPK